VPSFNPTEILDEKKSDDLSVNEDRIIGVNCDDDPVPNRTRTSSSIDHENSSDPILSLLPLGVSNLIYDDDSYISDGGSGKDAGVVFSS
jgi:hypothetical protein